MKRFYLQKSSECVLTQKEFEDAVKSNAESDDFVPLGEFKDKSQARRYYHQVYLKKEGRYE